jgi:hypothetical protein
VRFYLNEASIQGQFDDDAEFRLLLEALLEARSRSPILAAMRTTPMLADRPVAHGRSLRDTVRSWRGQPVAGATLAWVGRTGPFIHDDRLEEEQDLFQCLGVEVTDGGLGEAARRLKAGEEAVSMSFPGGNPNFAHTPLLVVHGFEDEPIASFEVANFWHAADAVATAQAREVPAGNWKEMVEAARIRFPKLLLPNSLSEDRRLSCEPFDAVIRDRFYALLGYLETYMKGRDKDGIEGPAAREVLEKQFRGDRPLFSPESDTNQREHRADMTFPDPSGGSDIFAHWHGKISHRCFRMHFEWPVASNVKRLKILYIGPKLTKA